jgi:hypothetical protein
MKNDSVLCDQFHDLTSEKYIAKGELNQLGRSYDLVSVCELWILLMIGTRLRDSVTDRHKAA